MMENKYKLIISQVSPLDIKEEDVKDTLQLKDDLSMDSMAFVNMVVAIENVYGFDFDDEYISYEKLNTVKDVGDYIQTKLDRKG